MSDGNALWDKTYTATNNDELNAAYDAWACDYDTDTLDGMGYVAPQKASTLLDAYLESKKSRILDAGCGTGLVGAALEDIGYERLDATDLCDCMLKEADKKDVYNKVFQGDLSAGLKVDDNTYDATICVGTFTYAHVGGEGFHELLRVTKPNGYVCFTIRDGAYDEYGYRKAMLSLEKSKAWELMEMWSDDYLRKEDVDAKYCLYKVNEISASL
jgi:predicted TPR repeat methyltransferase